MATRNLTIMFTDIKGFTERTSGSTRDDMTAWLAAHERLLVPVFQHFAGTIVKTIGDAFLVYFESPTDAVLCGVTIQEVLRQHNANASERERLEVRVAINVGEVQLKDNDLLGEAVNIAARLEGITEAGEVWFTDAVFQTMNRSEAPSSEVGERVFKGIPHPIRVYRVINEPGSEFVQNLASHVQLSDQGPVLQIRRPPALSNSPSHPGRKRTGLIAVVLGTVVAVTAALMTLLPSAAERALRDAWLLLEQGRASSALSILELALSEDPTNTLLITSAIGAAERNLAEIEARGAYTEALQWLDAALQEKDYLEPLRPRLMLLDARVAVHDLLGDIEYQTAFYPQPLKDFLRRYPNNADAPYELSELLNGQWYDITRLWLYREALDMGHPADENVMQFATAVLSEGSMHSDRLEMARELLLQHYPEQGTQWARSAMDGSNPLAFSNAWKVLEATGTGFEEREYYVALYSLLNASNMERSREALTILARQESVERRQQVLAFLGTLVETFPRYLMYGAIRDEIQKTLQELQMSWPNAQAMTPANHGKRATAKKLPTRQIVYSQEDAIFPAHFSSEESELERLRRENEQLKKLLIDRDLELHSLKTST